MKIFILSATLFMSSLLELQAQTRLIEKVQSTNPNEIIIPYEKYQLANGLTLIIHEDHSDPIVHVDVTYHVGSAREEIAKSGFAHFFEHMMFQGSENVGDEQHFKIVSEAGGTLNGTTNRDRTNYFETLPANQLEIALWLEADRMGFLLDSVTQKKFEIQRSTVKNERGQNYDNRPYGLVGETTSKTLYPYGHPYSWLTIGYVEDLDRVSVEDLKNFFLRWYGPNNATLTVGGDVNPQEVLKLTEKYFGTIPRGPEVRKMSLPAPQLEKNRYTWYEDKVRFPLLQLTFPTVPFYHPDEVALDCLAEILGGGNNSLFYKNFVKNQLAVQAQVNHPCTELSGELSMTVVAFPGKSLAEMEAIVRNTLLEFESRGVIDDDLIRFKAAYETGLINSLQSVSGKVSQLAAYQTFSGNPNYTPIATKANAALTKEDVLRVYNNYVKNKFSVVLSVVPFGEGKLAASQEKYVVSKTEGAISIKEDYRGLKYVKARDSFNRRVKPEAGPNPVVIVPALYKGGFENGIRYIGTVNEELPLVTIQLSMPGGHRLNATNLNKAGLASLVSDLMNESTEKYSSEDMANELDKLGSSVYFSAGSDNITLVIQSLVKNLDKTLDLTAEKLFRPRFSEEDFKRLKNQQLEGIANQSTQPVAIANKAFAKLLWGDNHILGVPTSGTTSSVESITLEDVKSFYKSYFSPKKGQMVVVGAIDQKTLEQKLDFLKKWSGPDYSIAPLPPARFNDVTRLFVIDKEKAPQSEIRIGFTSMPYDALGTYYRSSLMNFNLGGAFNSRINLNLREDKGYTYGARSFFSGGEDYGSFTASAGVKGDKTDASVIEFMKEINLFKDKGINSTELSFMRSAIGQSEARNYETPIQKAGFLRRILQYNLPEDYTTKQNDILQKISQAEINTLAKKQLQSEKAYLLVVGDKKSILPGLLKLGYPIVEMDKDGNIIGGIPASGTSPMEPEAAPVEKVQPSEKPEMRPAKDDASPAKKPKK
jgi:zinc protease